MNPKPMYVERSEQGDVIAYYVLLCPKCKQYNTFHPKYNLATLDGTVPARCKAYECLAVFSIVRGRAVIVNNMPKPDIKKPEPDKNAPRIHGGVSPGNFTLPRNSQN